MTNEKGLIKPEELVKHVPDAASEFVQPYLLAIYDDVPDQIGTGFLTLWNGHPLLVTAKHVLYGHSFEDDPCSKQIFVGGELKTIQEVAASPIIEDQRLDLSILHMKDVPHERCLPYTCLKFQSVPPKMLSIMGFLERDFRRSKLESTLTPKPFIYTDKLKPLDEEFIGITYLRRGRTTATGLSELAPIPRGLSGTMMVSATALLRETVEVFGVFTDERREQGYVFGSHINALQPLMQRLIV